jgi:hypothetical protein
MRRSFGKFRIKEIVILILGLNTSNFINNMIKQFIKKEDGFNEY